MASLLQTDYVGSRYSLLEFYLYKDVSGEDFYVDAVHIGKRPTTSDEHGTEPPSAIRQQQSNTFPHALNLMNI